MAEPEAHDTGTDSRAERQRWRRQRWGLLHGGALCERQALPDGVWRYRSDFPLTRALAAVQQHALAAAVGPAALLKDDVKRRVSRVEIAGEPYVVKEFRRPGPWWVFAPDYRSWWHNWRLELAGFPVPRYYAWLRARDGRAYIVLEHLPGRSLDEALLAALPHPAEFDRLTGLALDLLARLYRAGMVHEDYKCQNLLVGPTGGSRPPLGLIDNDAVLFERRIRPTDLARNRRHLTRTLAPDGGLPERMGERFDRFFAAGPPP